MSLNPPVTAALNRGPKTGNPSETQPTTNRERVKSELRGMTMDQQVNRLAPDLPPPPDRAQIGLQNVLDVRPVTDYARALGGALRLEGGAASHKVQRGIVALAETATAVRHAATDLIDKSSVTRKDRAGDPVFPSIPDARAFGESVRALGASRLDGTLQNAEAATDGLSASIDEATSAGNEAALAVFQGRAVLQGRESWRSNAAEPTPEDVDNGVVEDEIKAVHKAAGVGRIGNKDRADGSREVKDWCGFSVMSNLVRGAGLDGDHLGNTNHTNHGLYFFTYGQAGHSGNYQRFVWSEETNRWMRVEEYHALRGAQRVFYGHTKDPKHARVSGVRDIKEALAGGMRPGDVIIRDTDRNGTGNHYGMADASVREDGVLTTLEGNFDKGHTAGADGGARRDREGDLVAASREKFKDAGSGEQRTRSGFAAVTHDALAIGKKAKARKVDGSQTAKGGDIRVIGRPSMCDFEQHTYSKTMPKDPTVSPTAIEAAKAKPPRKSARAMSSKKA
jgi:hypothetical protein